MLTDLICSETESSSPELRDAECGAPIIASVKRLPVTVVIDPHDGLAGSPVTLGMYGPTGRGISRYCQDGHAP